ncbi:F-box domain-containing protein [Favolaschia claudopus]|uniref:F-box domain-containing protein n=1 Tax=Favolaschia claudopus TaxID=2862362 RepID=A0AAW0CA10_9AGAR
MLITLATDRARVAEIQTQLFALGETEALTPIELEDEQATAQKRLDSYKYPILTLPNEITSEIFLQFLPQYPELPILDNAIGPTHSYPNYHSPVRLTHICRKWRAVAIATPALWKGLFVSDTHIKPKFVGRAALIDMWLSRSGSCPLSISVFGLTGGPPDHLQKIWSAILPYRTRWHDINFVLHFKPGSLPTLVSPMPALRSLHLMLVSDSHSPTAFASCEMPQLREAVLISNSTLLNVELSLPWAQLTSLSLLYVTPGITFGILKKTPLLVSCTLGFLRLEGPLQYSGPDLGLPSLTSLVFQRDHVDDVAGILNSFVVPALHRLEIPEPCLGSGPVESLKQFISKSGSTLRELIITCREGSLHSSRITDERYRAACPSVQHFSSDFLPDDQGDSSGTLCGTQETQSNESDAEDSEQEAESDTEDTEEEQSDSDGSENEHGNSGSEQELE